MCKLKFKALASSVSWLIDLRQEGNVATLELPSSKEATVQRTSLRRALKETPYNNLHKVYNKNLVKGEEQELENHLKRRRDQARRMTQRVLETNENYNTLPSSTSQQSLDFGRRRHTHNGWMDNGVVVVAEDTVDADDGAGAIVGKLEQVPASQRQGVAVLLQIHSDIRRRKRASIDNRHNHDKEKINKWKAAVEEINERMATTKL